LYIEQVGKKFRTRLEEIDPDDIRGAFTSVFSSLQRGKALEKYVFLAGKYLLLNDGTGFFSSNKVHGHKNLSTVFARLMVLAFLIDQAEQMCCSLFQGALEEQKGRKTYLWRRVREFSTTHTILSWETLYRAIIAGNSREIPILNSC
jgi:hypothetical protein